MKRVFIESFKSIGRYLILCGKQQIVTAKTVRGAQIFVAVFFVVAVNVIRHAPGVVKSFDADCNPQLCVVLTRQHI